MQFSLGYFFRKAFGIQKRLDQLGERIKDLQQACDVLSENYRKIASTYSAEPKIMVPLLSGGLGNQLFQISCAYSLCRKFNYKLKLNYALYISYGQGHHPEEYRDTLYRGIETTDIIPDYKVCYTPHKFKAIGEPLGAKVLLEGYFQSSKYFSNYKEELRHFFNLPPEEMARARAYLDKDNRRNVGIHIRLGDYLNYPGLQAFPESYFRSAAALFKGSNRLIICSDQPEEAYRILKDKRFWFGKSFKPEIYRGGSEMADLVLLSQCDNLIMSNSTFSYWAYFFGKTKNKVIAPKQWLNQKIHRIITMTFMKKIGF